MNTVEASKKSRLTLSLVVGLSAFTGAASEENSIRPFRAGTERRPDNPVDAWMNAHAATTGAEIYGPKTRTASSARGRSCLAVARL